MLDYLTDDKKQNVEGQIGFFDAAVKAGREEFRIGPMPDLSAADKLDMEKEVTGMYLSGHPMAAYADVYVKYHAARIGDILEEAKEGTGALRDGATVTVLGIITKVQLKVTKSNSTMAFVALEDLYGSIRMLVFPKTLAEHAELIAEGRIVKVIARISVRDESEAELICQTIAEVPKPGSDGPKQANHSHSRPGLYLKVSGAEDALYQKAMKYIAVFDGPTPLYLYFCDSKKLMAAPLSKRVSINDVLMRELKKLLGENNVALVENIQQ